MWKLNNIYFDFLNINWSCKDGLTFGASNFPFGRQVSHPYRVKMRMWDVFFLVGALIQNQKRPCPTPMYFSALCNAMFWWTEEGNVTFYDVIFVPHSGYYSPSCNMFLAWIYFWIGRTVLLRSTPSRRLYFTLSPPGGSWWLPAFFKRQKLKCSIIYRKIWKWLQKINTKGK